MRRVANWFLRLSGVCLLLAALAGAQTPIHEGEFTTHTTNPPSYNTPLVTGPDDALYVCFIDPQLRTVLVKRDPQTAVWSAPTVLTTTTLADAGHTLCSIAQDRYGYLHAVYNMHSTPWQYHVSAVPHSITPMVFRGQPAGTGGYSIPEEAGCTGTCKEQWNANEPGIAAIPGNQITYPTFGHDQQGELYLAFRECLECGINYHERQWSMGVTKYDVTTQTWHRVQGIRPFATQPDKVAMGANLFGDPFGRLHLTWIWCNQYTQEEGGQACFAHPNFVSYAFTADGGAHWHTSDGTTLTLPLDIPRSEVIADGTWFTTNGVPEGYAGKTNVLTSLQHAARPFVTVFVNKPDANKGVPARAPLIYNGGWPDIPLVVSYGPYATYEDRAGVWTAVSSGLRFHRSTDHGQTWTLTEVDVARGPFHPSVDKEYLLRTNRLRVYANNQTTGLLVIWTMPYE